MNFPIIVASLTREATTDAFLTGDLRKWHNTEAEAVLALVAASQRVGRPRRVESFLLPDRQLPEWAANRSPGAATADPAGLARLVSPLVLPPAGLLRCCDAALPDREVVVPAEEGIDYFFQRHCGVVQLGPRKFRAHTGSGQHLGNFESSGRAQAAVEEVDGERPKKFQAWLKKL